MADLRLSYYPDITQHRSDVEVRDAILVFTSALNAELNRLTGQSYAIQVLPVMTVEKQTAAIADGGCEIALIKPSAYIYAHRRNPNVHADAVALRMIDSTVDDKYFAQVYAHVRLKVTDFAGLRDVCRGELSARPRLAFGDSFSTSNFLIPAALMTKNGCYPFTRFKSVEFFGGHEKAAQAVYEGRADVGAGHDGVIFDLAKQKGFQDAERNLVRIGRSVIQSDPVAVAVGDSALRDAIRRSLLAISSQEPVQRALDVFWGAVKGLGPTEDKDYDDIAKAMDSLGIPEADVLGA